MAWIFGGMLIISCGRWGGKVQESQTIEELAAKRGYNRSLLDTTVLPCENFYRYAAGGWLEKNPIPGTESRWGVFNVLAKENDVKLKDILEELQQSEENYSKGSYEQITRDFYRSAIDTITIAQRGAEPLQHFFQMIDSLPSRKELGRLLGKLKYRGVAQLFGFNVNVDSKNSMSNAAYFTQGGLGLPDISYYLDNDSNTIAIRKDYVRYMEKIFILSGVENGAGSAASVLAIETALAKSSMTKEAMRDPYKTYNKMTFDAFSAEYAGINWAEFLQEIKIDSISSVVVVSKVFYHNLSDIIRRFGVEEWKNYLKWQVANNLSAYLPPAFEKASFEFYQTRLRGTKEMKPRWEKAVGAVNSYLGEPMGKLFVDKHFTPEAKALVAEMVEDLRVAFKQRIEHLDWMGEETKKNALEKLKAFTYKIGYPDKWRDFTDLDIQPDKLIENMVEVNKKRSRRAAKKLHSPVDRNEWGMSPQTVNAYYNATKNEIVFPAGILQPPFFDIQADDALNYGGIGAVIGHEFSHGFDDKGSQFGADGNLFNWWTMEDRERFGERTDKIVQQFNGYEVLDGVFIKGNFTQGENIADLAGLTLAYYALKNKLERLPNTYRPPSDGFTHDQRFFLSWAQVWAQNITEQELRQRILTDPHAPGEYRVLGPLSNMPEFHQACGCQPGDKLYTDPQKRVIIW
jgi:putative endopeptidase